MVQANQQYIMSLRLSSFIAFKFGKKLERKYNITMRLSIDFECVLWEMWLLQMCFIYVVAFTNWNVLRLTQCMFYWCSHQNTQRRQVKLINVPLKVLCPLFMTKVVEVGSTFRARVAKAMLEKQDYFIIFFFYFILLAFFTSCQ